MEFISNECGALERKFPTAVTEGATVHGFVLRKCLGAGGVAEAWAVEKEGVQAVMKIMTGMIAIMGMGGGEVKTECEFAESAKAHAVQRGRGHEIANCFAHGREAVEPPEDSEEETRYLVFIVFERMAGKELGRVLKAHPEEPAPVLANLADVFAAVSKIWIAIDDLSQPLDHVRLFHDDVQPENIMITDDGSVGLIDYGFSSKCCAVEEFPSKCNDPSVEPSCFRDRAWRSLPVQGRCLAQNFISMLVKFRDHRDGVIGWWMALKDSPPDEALQVVKDTMRVKYTEQWTDACDIALQMSLASMSNSIDGLSEAQLAATFPPTDLLQAFQNAQDSLR